MEWKLYIDGKDAYSYYGLCVSDGSYIDLVCLPSLKDVPFNDWHERNGIDPDLTAPVLAPKEVTIDFYIIGEISKFNGLMQVLSDGAFHTFRFDEIGLTKSLRLVKCGNVKSIQHLHKFSLTFSDDNPLLGYEYVAPTSALLPLYDYRLDDIDLSYYGIRVLQGTYDEVISMPDVKENLVRNIQSISGQYYDGKNVTYKSRTVGIKCLMRTRTLAEFWQNRNALLYNLVSPGARLFRVEKLNKDIPCFYKSCSVQSFHPDGGNVWFEFTLNLEFFNGII